MVCPLDENDFCPVHQVHHRHLLKLLALDPGPAGDKHRAAWDALYGVFPKNKRPETYSAGQGLSDVCPFLGPPSLNEAGRSITRSCIPCGKGKALLLKVFTCLNAEFPGLQVDARQCHICKKGWK